MSYRVETSELAIADLRRLAAFLFSKSPRAADKAIDLILDGIASLGDMPVRGKASPDGSMRVLPLRFGSRGYVIQYSVRAETVLVLRIFHAREDR